MSDLRRLLGKENGSICQGVAASPQVWAAFKLLMNEDRVGAEQRFQRILKENPADHEALAGLAICVAERTGRFVSATKLARESVRRAPKSSAGYFALGYIHLLGSKLEQGHRYLMKAKHLAPRDPRLNLGFALYDRERPPVIADLSRMHPANRFLGGTRSLMRSQVHRVLAVAMLAGGCYVATAILV